MQLKRPGDEVLKHGSSLRNATSLGSVGTDRAAQRSEHRRSGVLSQRRRRTASAGERIVARIRSSRLLSGGRNRRFQACVACQPQRPQSGGLFTPGRTRCLVFSHCSLPLLQLLFLFLEGPFGAVTRPFSVDVQSGYSFSSESACRTELPCLRDRMPPADVGCSTEPTPVQVILFRPPRAGAGIRLERCCQDKAQAVLESVRVWIV